MLSLPSFAKIVWFTYLQQLVQFDSYLFQLLLEMLIFWKFLVVFLQCINV